MGRVKPLHFFWIRLELINLFTGTIYVFVHLLNLCLENVYLKTYLSNTPNTVIKYKYKYTVWDFIKYKYKYAVFVFVFVFANTNTYLIPALAGCQAITSTDYFCSASGIIFVFCKHLFMLLLKTAPPLGTNPSLTSTCNQRQWWSSKWVPGHQQHQ